MNGSLVLENITTEQLTLIVRGMVDERIAEIINDPDFGLEIRDEIKEILLRQEAEIDAGNYGRPLEDVVKELGMT